MSPLRSGEVTKMQREQRIYLMDIFDFAPLVESIDSDGGMIKSYPINRAMSGSVFNPTGSFQFRNQITITECDAALRTEIGVTFRMGDRITVITRSGISINPEIYYINGAPVIFRTTQIIPLSRVLS